MSNVYFNDIRSHIVDKIETAQNSIKVAMAWFTNKVIFQLLIDKAAGGVKVDLVLSDSDINFASAYALKFESLTRKGANVVVSISNSGYHFMHHKFVVIDKKSVITGSYNWSNNAHNNHENIMILDDAGVANIYDIQFDRLLNSEDTIPLSNFLEENLLKADCDVRAADSALADLTEEFNRQIASAMVIAAELNLGIRMSIIDGMIKRYTAVGAAKKLSNNAEQSGFKKLMEVNRSELTFEYLTARERFAPLFDKLTIRNAKEKLRPYLRDAVDAL